jgi:putative transposase
MDKKVPSDNNQSPHENEAFQDMTRSQRSHYNRVKKKDVISVPELKRRDHQEHSGLHPKLQSFVANLLVIAQRDYLEAIHLCAVHEAERLIAEDGEYIAEAEWPTYDKIRVLAQQTSDPYRAKQHRAQAFQAQRTTREPDERLDAEHRNHIWQCDHHRLNILVTNPETGKPERPWMTAIIDDYSRAIVGIYISFDHPNSNSIALALHHALLSKEQNPAWIMYGIPIMFYCDNGKDYRSKHIREVCLHFQIELRFHEPYLASSKGKIERWFRTLEEMCIRKLVGYTGGNPKARLSNVKPYPSIEQLHVRIESFIVNEYHERIHRSSRSCPLDRWQQDMQPVRAVEDARLLDVLLLCVKRKVSRQGITLNHVLYRDPNRQLIAHVGEQVHVYYRPDDVTRVHIYNAQGEYICTAVQE